jgi:hypothetical protein
MTPSGLSIGIILNTKLSLSSLASLQSLIKKSMTPFIIQLLFDSPGCTLALIITPFF